MEDDNSDYRVRRRVGPRHGPPPLFFMGGGVDFEVDLATFLLSISVLSKSRKSPSLYPGLGLFGDFLGTLLGGLFAVYFGC